MSYTFRGDSLTRKFRSDDVCVSCWRPSADLALCVTIACSIRQVAPQGCAHGHSHCLGAVFTSDADCSGSMAASMSSRSTESEPFCMMHHKMHHKPTAMLLGPAALRLRCISSLRWPQCRHPRKWQLVVPVQHSDVQRVSAGRAGQPAT